MFSLSLKHTHHLTALSLVNIVNCYKFIIAWVLEGLTFFGVVKSLCCCQKFTEQGRQINVDI